MGPEGGGPSFQRGKSRLVKWTKVRWFLGGSKTRKPRLCGARRRSRSGYKWPSDIRATPGQCLSKPGRAPRFSSGRNSSSDGSSRKQIASRLNHVRSRGKLNFPRTAFSSRLVPLGTRRKSYVFFRKVLTSTLEMSMASQPCTRWVLLPCLGTIVPISTFFRLHHRLPEPRFLHVQDGCSSLQLSNFGSGMLAFPGLGGTVQPNLLHRVLSHRVVMLDWLLISQEPRRALFLFSYKYNSPGGRPLPEAKSVYVHLEWDN